MQLGGAERPQVPNWTAASGLVTDLRTKPACILSFAVFWQPGMSCHILQPYMCKIGCCCCNCKSGVVSPHNYDVLLSQLAQLGTTLPPLG